MPTPANAPSRSVEALTLDDVERRFRGWIRETVDEPVTDQVQAYVKELEQAVGNMVEIEQSGPDFYDRFLEQLDSDLMGEADRQRSAVFQIVVDLSGADPPLPETLEVEAGPSPLAPPEPLVRPTWAQRVRVRFSRRDRRDVPALLLARLYTAEIARRLEPVLNNVARLESLALEAIRGRLHTEGGVEVRPAEVESVREEAEAAVQQMRSVLEDVAEALGRALHAPAVSVSADDVRESADRAERERERLLARWQSLENALRANTRSEAVLTRALFRLDVARQETIAELEQAIAAGADAPLRRLTDGLRELADRAAVEVAEKPDLIVRLRAEAESLFEREADEYAADLVTRLRSVADALDARVEPIPDLIPDELLISDDPIERIPARPEELDLRDAPVEELVRTTCEGVLPRWMKREVSEAAEEVAVLGRELGRLRNAVDFHIRAPQRGDFGSEHEAADLVVGILQRSADQVDDLRQTQLETLTAVVEGFDRIVAEEGEAIQVAVAERAFMKIRSEIAEEQAVQHLSSGREWIRRMVDSAIRVGRQGWATSQAAFTSTRYWARRQLRMDEVEREKMLESLEQSLLDEYGVLQLPPLYQQLFDVEAEVPWQELLVPRDNELASLRRAYARWGRGQAATVAIIGEKGSGKTTLVRLATDQVVADRTIRRVTLGRTIAESAELAAELATAFELESDTLDELAREMAAVDEPAVAIIEDAHHLFIRALGGFDVLEQFLELMEETKDKVFWIITIDEFAWNYLDRAMGLSPHFTHEINTTNIPADRLEQAVMARHDVSGYSLEFETTHASAQRGWLDRLLGRRPEGELSAREVQRDVYFKELNQIAEGNIFLALFYWLRSIDRVDDHAIVITDPAIIDVEFLDRLPLPSLHTIAAVILHGGLSTREHMSIFQLTPAESRLQLASLADTHLLFRSTTDDEYKINKVLYRPFIRLLRSRNIF